MVRLVKDDLAFFLLAAFRELPELRAESFICRHHLYKLYRDSYNRDGSAVATIECPLLLHLYITDCLVFSKTRIIPDVLTRFEFALWELLDLLDDLTTIHGLKLMEHAVLNIARRRVVETLVANLVRPNSLSTVPLDQ